MQAVPCTGAGGQGPPLAQVAAQDQTPEERAVVVLLEVLDGLVVGALVALDHLAVEIERAGDLGAPGAVPAVAGQAHQKPLGRRVAPEPRIGDVRLGWNLLRGVAGLHQQADPAGLSHVAAEVREQGVLLDLAVQAQSAFGILVEAQVGVAGQEEAVASTVFEGHRRRPRTVATLVPQARLQGVRFAADHLQAGLVAGVRATARAHLDEPGQGVGRIQRAVHAAVGHDLAHADQGQQAQVGALVPRNGQRDPVEFDAQVPLLRPAHEEQGLPARVDRELRRRQQGAEVGHRPAVAGLEQQLADLHAVGTGFADHAPRGDLLGLEHEGIFGARRVGGADRVGDLDHVGLLGGAVAVVLGERGRHGGRHREREHQEQEQESSVHRSRTGSGKRPHTLRGVRSGGQPDHAPTGRGGDSLGSGRATTIGAARCQICERASDPSRCSADSRRSSHGSAQFSRTQLR